MAPNLRILRARDDVDPFRTVLCHEGRAGEGVDMLCLHYDFGIPGSPGTHAQAVGHPDGTVAHFYTAGILEETAGVFGVNLGQRCAVEGVNIQLLTSLQGVELAVVIEIVVVEQVVHQHLVDDRIAQVVQVADIDGNLLLVSASRRVLHELERVNVIEIRADCLAGLLPGLIGGNQHGVVAVLTVDVGKIAGKEVVVLVEDRIKIGNLAVDGGSLHALSLVQFLHIVAVEEL